MRSHPHALAVATITVVMLIWGSTFVVTKAAVAEIPPLTLAFVRFAIGALVLLPVAVVHRGRRGLFSAVPVRQVALLALAGVALFTAAFNYALIYGSAMQGNLCTSGMGRVAGAAEADASRRDAGDAGHRLLLAP